MTKKNKSTTMGIVYSTDPNFVFQPEEDNIATLLPAEQRLKIKLETKHRAGKIVTTINGFVGTEEDIAALTKIIKNHCGTGGSHKENCIIIQGDHREKIAQFLKQKNYTQTKII